MTKAFSAAKLSQEIQDSILKKIKKRIPEIKGYADCELNSDDKLVMVSIPIARDEIIDVIFADKHSDETAEWYSEKRLDILAVEYAKIMVKHYRP